MKRCYGHPLGDCAGPLEREHYLPVGIQKMLGNVTVCGIAWQGGGEHKMAPGTYAASHVLCERHHDEFDGLDGNALAYFQNFKYVATPAFTVPDLGAAKLTPSIDGRALETWMLKTICGAISAKAIEGVTDVPVEWVRALFQRDPWPADWARYLSQGEWQPARDAVGIGISFEWAKSSLNGIVVDAFSFRTLFGVRPYGGPPARHPYAWILQAAYVGSIRR
jgi:hypothetical protein